MPQWCVVTSRDADGRPYSQDVFARSSFDAVIKAVSEQRGSQRVFRKPTEKTIFEVRVAGSKATQFVSYRRVWEWNLKRDPQVKSTPAPLPEAGPLTTYIVHSEDFSSAQN